MFAYIDIIPILIKEDTPIKRKLILKSPNVGKKY